MDGKQVIIPFDEYMELLEIKENYEESSGKKDLQETKVYLERLVAGLEQNSNRSVFDTATGKLITLLDVDDVKTVITTAFAK